VSFSIVVRLLKAFCFHDVRWFDTAMEVARRTIVLSFAAGILPLFFKHLANFKEKEYLRGVCGVVLMLPHDVKIETHRAAEIWHIRSLVNAERAWQPFHVLLIPYREFTQFVVCVMFFVLHRFGCLKIAYKGTQRKALRAKNGRLFFCMRISCNNFATAILKKRSK